MQVRKGDSKAGRKQASKQASSGSQQVSSHCCLSAPNTWWDSKERPDSQLLQHPKRKEALRQPSPDQVKVPQPRSGMVFPVPSA